MSTPGFSSLRFTESFGENFAEDVFSLTPPATRDPSVELAVTHLHRTEEQRRSAVVLLHGEFGSRLNWYRRDRRCIAVSLLQAGYDVWIPEMRGHGLSPRNQWWGKTQLEDYACFDLPAVQELALSHRPEQLHWMAVGVHGFALLHSLLSQHLPVDRLGQVCLIDLSAPRDVWQTLSLGFWASSRVRRRGWVQRSEVQGEAAGEIEAVSLLTQENIELTSTLKEMSTLPQLMLWQLYRCGHPSKEVRRAVSAWPGALTAAEYSRYAGSGFAPNAALPVALAKLLLAELPQAFAQPSCEPT